MTNSIIITDIVKKGRKYCVIMSNGVTVILLPYTIKKLRISKGNSYSTTQLQQLLEQAEEIECFESLLGILERGSYSEKDIRTKLKQKGYKPQSISLSIEKAKEMGYIDDDKYAKCYVENNKSGKGSYRLKNELKQKGVSDSIISEKMPSADEEYQACYELAKKYAKKNMEQKERNRLINKLLYRGFSYSDIKSVLSALSVDLENLDDE